ncbi:hypothetical protein ACFYXC_24510 [Streptomyces sp. NPDC002701]|uniref:hypothetical protein n=1 Tax=unclassified Streptomyces TaxID=2593676 RepID=UPI0036AFADCE
MRSRTEPRRRLTAACALISALALGGVYAGQSVAADSSSPPSGGSSSTPPKDDGPTDSADWTRQDKASRAYTACMRDNGLEDFPDLVIHTADDGHGVKVRIERGDRAKHPDPGSKEFRKAAKACGHILEDIGVKLPVPPRDLPGRGDRPGPGCGEHRPDEKGSGGQREDREAEPSAAGLVLSG